VTSGTRASASREFAVSWIGNEAELLWLRGSLEFVLSPKQRCDARPRQSRNLPQYVFHFHLGGSVPNDAESAQTHCVQQARRVASRIEASRYKHIRVQHNVAAIYVHGHALS